MPEVCHHGVYEYACVGCNPPLCKKCKRPQSAKERRDKKCLFCERTDREEKTAQKG